MPAISSVMESNEKSSLLERRESREALPPPVVLSPQRRRCVLPRVLTPYYLGILCLVTIILRTVLLCNYLISERSATRGQDRHVKLAHKLLAEHPLIDGHNDLLIFVRYAYKNKIEKTSFNELFEHGGLAQHTDLPRLKAGQVGGAFWSTFMPCPKNGSDFSNENYYSTVRGTLEQFDLFSRISERFPDSFPSTPDSSPSSALQTFSSSRLISPLGIEGLHQIGNSLSTLRLYHTLGARYATLTWNCHNQYADAALTMDHSGRGIHVATPKWHGLSPAGRGLVLEMNRLGMLVDLSHTSAETMRDVLVGNSNGTSSLTIAGQKHKWQGSIAPPIFSHSSAYSICPHPRNVPDDVLHLVAQRRGVVMVNFSPDFVSCRARNATERTGGADDALPVFERGNSTLAHVVRHIMHIGGLVGYEHVGLGSDFDGIESTPDGLDGVDKYPTLVAELFRQGLGWAQIKGVVGGNVLRVWSEAEEVAMRLRREGWRPLEDEDVQLW